MNITFKSIIGKHILVGLIYIDGNGIEINRLQLYGEIIESKKNEAITIRKTNSNELFYLPPDISSIKIAKQGEYTLKLTGEIISNPDLLATWTIYKSQHNF